MAKANSTRNTSSAPSAAESPSGTHPESAASVQSLGRDATSYLCGCSDTFSQLVSLFSVIEKEIESTNDSGYHDRHLLNLVRVGKTIATDYEDIAETWRSEIEKSSGLMVAEGGAA